MSEPTRLSERAAGLGRDIAFPMTDRDVQRIVGGTRRLLRRRKSRRTALASLGGVALAGAGLWWALAPSGTGSSSKLASHAAAGQAATMGRPGAAMAGAAPARRRATADPVGGWLGDDAARPRHPRPGCQPGPQSRRRGAGARTDAGRGGAQPRARVRGPRGRRDGPGAGHHLHCRARRRSRGGLRRAGHRSRQLGRRAPGSAGREQRVVPAAAGARGAGAGGSRRRAVACGGRGARGGATRRRGGAAGAGGPRLAAGSRRPRWPHSRWVGC